MGLFDIFGKSNSAAAPATPALEAQAVAPKGPAPVDAAVYAAMLAGMNPVPDSLREIQAQEPMSPAAMRAAQRSMNTWQGQGQEASAMRL